MLIQPIDLQLKRVEEGNAKEYQVVENDDQYLEEELPALMSEENDSDRETDVESLENGELEDLLEDKRQSQGLVVRVKEDDESTH